MAAALHTDLGVLAVMVDLALRTDLLCKVGEWVSTLKPWVIYSIKLLTLLADSIISYNGSGWANTSHSSLPVKGVRDYALLVSSARPLDCTDVLAGVVDAGVSRRTVLVHVAVRFDYFWT